MILEGKYHYDNRSFLTSLFGKKILPIAVDYEFINYDINEKLLPEKNAIFTTRSDRNLDFLLGIFEKIMEHSYIMEEFTSIIRRKKHMKLLN